MKKLSLLCILACIVLIFASCANNNNVDGSDDGEIGDGTTADMMPNDPEPDDNDEEETTTDGDEQGTNDESNDDGDGAGEQTANVKTITSDTGTGLNLVIEYTVGEKLDGVRNIEVAVYIESFSLNVTARGNTNYVRVGDETFYFSTDAISYDGTAKTRMRVATHTFTTDTENATLPIYATWNFNGVYSEKPISAIIIENNIEL